MINTVTDRDVQAFLSRPGYSLWRKNVHSVSGCAHPVKLRGISQIKHRDSGEVLHDTSGSTWVPCGTRRANDCLPCSARYADDAFHLIRSGLTGNEDKGITTTVADRPRLFVTLTAPSFGPVHSRPTLPGGKTRPCSCGTWHSQNYPNLGHAVNPEEYDYEAAVLWQVSASHLWGRFTTYLRRAIAQAAGIPISRLNERVRLSFAKVGEFQRRGMVHFHAATRLDGPGGIGDTPPAWATPQLLESAVRTAASTAAVPIRRPNGQRLMLRFGTQLDIRDVTTASKEKEGTAFDPERLAGYIAKYATKSTGASEDQIERRIKDEALIERLPVAEHYKRMMRTAWQLGGLEQYAELKLRHWAHMLGFRGHILTKSRTWSTTMGELRNERARWRLLATLTELGITNENEVLVINDWEPTGFGYTTDVERELADVIARKLTEHRKARL